jgi:DNA repair ATPase RecN
MDETTVIVNSGQPEPGSTDEVSPDLEQIEDVATVADEILVEVKECRTRLDQSTADLERLQSAGGPARTELVQECLTEIKTLRQEYQSLLNELKELRREALHDSRSSIPLTSPQTPEVETEAEIAEPESVVVPVESAPKRKRYRI